MKCAPNRFFAANRLLLNRLLDRIGGSLSVSKNPLLENRLELIDGWDFLIINPPKVFFS